MCDSDHNMLSSVLSENGVSGHFWVLHCECHFNAIEGVVNELNLLNVNEWLSEDHRDVEISVRFLLSIHMAYYNAHYLEWIVMNFSKFIDYTCLRSPVILSA